MALNLLLLAEIDFGPADRNQGSLCLLLRAPTLIESMRKMKLMLVVPIAAGGSS